MDSQNSIKNHKTLHFFKNEDKSEQNFVEKWGKKDIKSLFLLPFNDLVYQAHKVHRENFDSNAVQLSTLL